MVYTARIRFVDDGTERNVSISDLLGEENLPYGYFDEDIFFYGLSQEQAKKALLSQEPCEGEWVILELDDLITGEVRPCRLEGTDAISGADVKEDEVQFWGVYRNNPDGTQTHILDTVTEEDAEHVLDLMNEFECFHLNKLAGIHHGK
jgi:hypothetical protein